MTSVRLPEQYGHNVARATEPRSEKQRQADLDEIRWYRSLEDQVRTQVAGNIYDQETFELTSKLLKRNPEYYTVWNVRRRCLISGYLSKSSAGSSSSKALPSSLATDTPTRSSDTLSPPSSLETPQAPDSPITGKTGTTADADADGSWENDLDVIKSELGFTLPRLKEHPKCYWIWNYRQWILRMAKKRLPVAVARKVWEEELGLDTYMLSKDTRNFHAWGYRRILVEQLESPALAGQSMVESEFAYADAKIKGDLSNFSAWHNRSLLIPRLLAEREADDATRKAFLEAELDRIADGLNVGPDDQSLWYYHQYLIRNVRGNLGDAQIAPALTNEQRQSYLEREIENFQDFLTDYDDSKLLYEGLIDCKVGLAHLRGQSAGMADDSELASWLEKLRELDPKHSGRWGDLEKDLRVV